MGSGKVMVMTSLDALLDPLSRCLDVELAERLAAFQVDQSVQSRIEVLAEGANDGTLSDDERAEYEAIINAADFISILKVKAGRLLKSNGG